jgi:hypothetical protein
VVLWACNGLYLIYLHKTYTKEEIDAFFEPITSKYGIKIVYEIGGDFFSPLENPPILAGPAKGSKIEPIRHRVLVHYVDILQKALEKYPVQVIKNHLNVIQFAGEIDDHGFMAGGTYDPFRRILYIANNGSQKDNRSIYVFHHEFSSLLLTSHSFYMNPWTDNNQKEFEYLYDTTKNALKTYNSTSLVGTEVDYEKGFIDTYGQTNFENDFNEYSAMIFTYPQKFKEIMDQYPRVRGKFLVWLEYYQNIDPIFTEEYLLGSK